MKPLQIVTKHGATSLGRYAWINCTGISGLVRQSIDRAMASQRSVLLCLNEGERRLTPWDLSTTLADRLSGALQGIAPADCGRLTIIYQPAQTSWSVDDAQHVRIVHRIIRDLFIERYGRDLARRIAIIYAGPIFEEEQSWILEDINVDGILSNQKSEVRK